MHARLQGSALTQVFGMSWDGNSGQRPQLIEDFGERGTASIVHNDQGVDGELDQSIRKTQEVPRRFIGGDYNWNQRSAAESRNRAPKTIRRTVQHESLGRP